MMAAYEVFISFKNTDKFGRRTRDADMAERLYYALKEKNISAFYSNISIQATAHAKFAQAIDKALEQCSILVAVGTSREHLESAWVYDEIDTFRNEMLNGNKPEGKSAIISYISEGYPQNKLPLLLRKCQSYYDLDQLVEFIVNHRKKDGDLRNRRPEPAKVQQPASAAEPVLNPGDTVLGCYRIVRQIGRGGSSVVYEAKDEQTGKHVAVKAVRYTQNKMTPTVYGSFLAEADLMKGLDHPCIPKIYGIERDDRGFAVVMDLAEGQPLDQYLQRHRVMAESMLRKVALQLGQVLQHLHSRKRPIIYRDMKPANIVMKPDGSVKLLDFGTAREYKEGALEDTVCLGTVGFAAPEQFGGMGQTDERTDIYALGVTLYNLSTGHDPKRPPYTILPVRQVDPRLSKGLEYIIEKCTRRDPEERFQSAQEFLDALRRIDRIKGRPLSERFFLWQLERQKKRRAKTSRPPAPKWTVPGQGPSAPVLTVPPTAPVAPVPVRPTPGFVPPGQGSSAPVLTVPPTAPVTPVPTRPTPGFVPPGPVRESLGETTVLGDTDDGNETLRLTAQKQLQLQEKASEAKPENWTDGVIAICVCAVKHEVYLRAAQETAEEARQKLLSEHPGGEILFSTDGVAVKAGQLLELVTGEDGQAVRFMWTGSACGGQPLTTQAWTAGDELSVLLDGETIRPKPPKAAPEENERRRELEAVIQKVKGVRAILSDRVFGQEQALDRLTEAYLRADLIRRTEAGPGGPVTAFLFTGPAGAGKGYAAECLASALKRPCKRIRLENIDDPALGAEESALEAVEEIVRFVQGEPRCLLILDGIGHAPAAILRPVTQGMDTGAFRFGEGEVSLKDTVLVLTADTDGKDAPETIRKRFAAESVISFCPLPPEVLHDILKRELLRCASGVRERFGVEVVLDEQVFTALLLTKGSRADAAGVCALAKEFFFREVSGLLSLVGTPAMQGDMGDLDRLLIVVDSDGEAARAMKLSETEERLSFRTERELPDDSKTARIRLIRQ